MLPDSSQTGDAQAQNDERPRNKARERPKNRYQEGETAQLQDRDHPRSQ